MSTGQFANTNQTGLVDVLNRPAYSLAMASRIVGLTQPRVSRWLRGYSYKYSPITGQPPVHRKLEPVIRRPVREPSVYVSFLDVVDLLFVKAFLNERISLQRLRQALIEAEEIIGKHRFAYKEFWTSGKNIYLQVRNHEGALLQLVSGGQWAFADVIRETGHQIDFEKETGISERWFPLGRENPVVLDPRVRFGAPTVYRRGILTANVYDFYLAENKNKRRVCSWFNLEPHEVDTAVRYQSLLAAA